MVWKGRPAGGERGGQRGEDMVWKGRPAGGERGESGPGGPCVPARGHLSEPGFGGAGRFAFRPGPGGWRQGRDAPRIHLWDSEWRRGR